MKYALCIVVGMILGMAALAIDEKMSDEGQRENLAFKYGVAYDMMQEDKLRHLACIQINDPLPRIPRGWNASTLPLEEMKDICEKEGKQLKYNGEKNSHGRFWSPVVRDN